MELFTKNFIKNYFIRNKKLFIISLIIMGVTLFCGVIFALMFVSDSFGQIPLSLLSFSNQDTVIGSEHRVTWYSLFFNNLFYDLITIVLGLLFSVISVILMVYNSFMVGLIFGIDPIFGILSLLPHGIFEFPSFVFALVGSFLVTKIVINFLKGIFTKNKTVKGVLTESTLLYKDILLCIIFIIILLLIAAFMEAYITPLCLAFY